MNVGHTLRLLLIALLPVVLGADWPQWRGPDGQGIAKNARIAAEWSETKNVAWRTEIPGRGWSSPVIAGRHVWLTTAHETAATEAEAAARLEANTGGQPLTVLSEVRIDAICIDKGQWRDPQTVGIAS